MPSRLLEIPREARLLNSTDATKILRSLEFESGRRITAKGKQIGLSLRFPRPLAPSDSALLDRYCQKLGRYASPIEELQEFVKSGAGFGDPVLNRIVERAAVGHVRRKYKSRGWKVKSKERDKIGYDLLCVKGATSEHVEVKGIRGQCQEFLITKNEVRRAKEDPAFVLFTVTSALVKPHETRYSGKQVLKRFNLTSLVYRAGLKR